MTTTTIEKVYQRLLEEPDNPDLMRILADALEDDGNIILATAYHWAANNGKWPFVRTERSTGLPVYDWDGEHRSGWADVDVPISARLPKILYDAIRRLINKQYGDVNDAFVLLSRVLPEYLRQMQ